MPYLMRVEKHTVGSYLHVIQRGTRGVVIAPSGREKQRFIENLFYLNSTQPSRDWELSVGHEMKLCWQNSWKKREPIVQVLAWTLMSNHFHLILREEIEGGVAKFMQRLCGSMTKYFNALHNEQGSLFQGSYKARSIDSDEDLRYVSAYVMGKNVFEILPGGIPAAVASFNQSWDQALEYPYSSLREYARWQSSPIMPETDNMLFALYESSRKFKSDVKDMVGAWQDRKADHAGFLIPSSLT